MRTVRRSFGPRSMAFLLLVLASMPVSRAARATEPLADDRARFDRLAAQVDAAYDTSRGGYVGKNGTPCESAIDLALLQAAAGAPGPWKDHAIATLEWTLGLRDTVGGGFQESARDQDVNQAF